MILQNGVYDESAVYITNGIIQQNPYIMYHISLYCLVISSFIIALITIHHIDKNEEIETKEKKTTSVKIYEIEEKKQAKRNKET